MIATCAIDAEIISWQHLITLKPSTIRDIVCAHGVLSRVWVAAYCYSAWVYALTNSFDPELQIVDENCPHFFLYIELVREIWIEIKCP